MIEKSQTRSFLKPAAWSQATILGLLLAGAGFAQWAQITGPVTDNAGAAIPDVKITVTNTDNGSDNGIARDTQTNGLGYYTVPLLNPGNYKSVAGKQGFRGQEQTGIQLRADRQATLDFKMEVEQLNQEPAQQDTTIRVDVQQVLVPVVVTDKKGHHVSGLRASDFRILEDGVQQQIAAFSSDTAGSVDDIGALSKPAAGGVAPTQGAAQPGPRHTFVICIDTLHASPANAARMREALENLFEKEKPTGAQGAAQYVLIGIGRQLQVLQAASTNPLAILLKIRGPSFQSAMEGLDASALSAQLQNIRSRMDEFCKRCACGTRSGRQNCDSDIDTLKQSVDAEADRWTAPTKGLLEQFKSVVEELAKLPTGRTLILVSDGFSINPKREFYAAVSAYLPSRPEFKLEESRDVDPALREALKIASERNVTIYTVDSRGGAAPSLASTGPMDAGASGSSSALGDLGPRNPNQSVRAGTLQSTAGTQANPFASAESASMEQLARATGGVYFHESADMLKQFHSALADGREYYVLAYRPKNSAQDGKFRSITVETNDKKLSVRAKAGYWAAGAAQ
jgi:VWFA-related protein